MRLPRDFHYRIAPSGAATALSAVKRLHARRHKGMGDTACALCGGLRLAVGEEVTETGLSMHMGALGLRAALMPGAGAGDIGLALESDAFWVRTEFDAARSSAGGRLEAASGVVSRVRVALEGSRAFAAGPGATLTPALELGLRLDGGDAERGRDSPPRARCRRSRSRRCSWCPFVRSRDIPDLARRRVGADRLRSRQETPLLSSATRAGETNVDTAAAVFKAHG